MTIVQPPEPIRLTGGIVAFEDERTIERSVRSLLDQRLPPGVAWDVVWVVVSPGEDRTVEIAERLAREEARVRVLVESRRRGKSAALAEIARRSEDGWTVLLNGDAVAMSDAVARMLAAAPPGTETFAVMARPTPASTGGGLLDRCTRLLWEIHHRLHARAIASGRGSHVSDELLLLPRSVLSRLPDGVVNDGAYLGVAVRTLGGELTYASDAHVAVVGPATWAGHVEQRRRVRGGHRQVAELLGNSPTTLDSEFASDVPGTLREISGARRSERAGPLVVGALVTADLLAMLLVAWDRLLRRPAPSLWSRIDPSIPSTLGAEGAGPGAPSGRTVTLEL